MPLSLLSPFIATTAPIGAEVVFQSLVHVSFTFCRMQDGKMMLYVISIRNLS